ncbi:MAG: PQQ-binding-like beta-propeller repeat protein, partial [Rickettsiales bacterium]|nr:PQQ-binding-like beta-propeller repeat protein [Rickettsiales bacterium]
MKRCALIFALVLSGCAADKVPLSGDRVSVFSSPDAAAGSVEKIVLARPYVSESWDSPSGNPANNKGHMAGRKSFDEKFRRDVGVNYGTRPMLYPPVADGNAVFAIDGNLHISAIDAATGVRLWHHTGLSNDDYLRFGALALSDGSLFAIANDSTLIRLDPKTGKETYRKNFGATLKSGLQACGGLLLFIGDEGELFAVDSATGEKKFGHRTIEEPFGLIRGSTPACSD